MNIKRLALCTILIWIIGTAFGFLTCGWLFNWVYEIPPIIWKDPETIIQTTNMIGANISGLIQALLFVLVYAIIQKGIPGEGVKKGIIYGLLIWLVGALPGMSSMPFFMTIAKTVIIYWIIQALIMNVIFGAIVGAIYKKK